MSEPTFDRPALRSLPDARPAPEPDRVLQSTLALVLAGGRGSRLEPLTDADAKPALPFGGHLNLIDFTLSNCINSGLRRVAVLTQYKAQSLIRHITRAWGSLDAGLGEFVDIVPAQQRIGEDWYRGTADAVFQNLDLLAETGARHVLVLAGDHVYKMDYGPMLREHLRRGAELSMACCEVPIEQAPAFGVVRCADDGRITAFEEKPAHPWSQRAHPGQALVSMGVYAFETAALVAALREDAADPASCHDFGHDLIPRLIRLARVYAHDFAASCVHPVGAQPYWRDVGTLDAYWQAHMELLGASPAFELDDETWPLRGLPAQLPPARFVCDEEGRSGMALDSLVDNGCVVRGATVRRSLLFAQARVGEGSIVEESLLLPGARVGRRVRLRRTIVDRRCALPDGLCVGLHPDEDRARFAISAGGICVVTAAMLAASGRD
ncbi:MAG: glucose-1-phosphate adenylyltransferase [Burkholderiales bacterium]|nr:glucose-1-phosphate adenylyltransferase [Burkholderiales bacterium]MDE2395421.1 glucose-1-phosphate adenylyltransferase [Burkholderiales bacterium]MDE2454623.1 glucose-1-phosphate adenylyltransferase [Burkholderiales bacterium]